MIEILDGVFVGGDVEVSTVVGAFVGAPDGVVKGKIVRRLDSQLIAELPKRLLIIVIIHDHFCVCGFLRYYRSDL